VKLTTHLHQPSAEVKECVELYLHSPNTPSWRGAQLKKSTGTTLPFTFTYASCIVDLPVPILFSYEDIRRKKTTSPLFVHFVHFVLRFKISLLTIIVNRLCLYAM